MLSCLTALIQVHSLILQVTHKISLPVSVRNNKFHMVIFFKSRHRGLQVLVACELVGEGVGTQPYIYIY